jgi:hypothetical protein
MTKKAITIRSVTSQRMLTGHRNLIGTVPDTPKFNSNNLFSLLFKTEYTEILTWAEMKIVHCC